MANDFKIPSTEIEMVLITSDSGKQYLITKRRGTETAFSIFSIIDGKTLRLGRGNSPLDLEEEFVK